MFTILNPWAKTFIANASKEQYDTIHSKKGKFEDIPLYKYTMPNGRVYFEKTSKLTWPTIYLGLQDVRGVWVKESLWAFENIHANQARIRETNGNSNSNQGDQPWLVNGENVRGYTQSQIREFQKNAGNGHWVNGYWQPDSAGIAKEREDLDREFAREHPAQYRMREFGRKEYEKEQARDRKSMLRTCPQWVSDFVTEVEQKSTNGTRLDDIERTLMKESSTEDRKIAVLNVVGRRNGVFYSGALPGKEAPGGVLGSLCGDVPEYLDERARRKYIPR